MRISAELAGKLLYYMKLMRELENRLEKMYRQSKIVGSVYVGRGQEAISVGSAILTEPNDVVCPSHRDLGAFLIRGMKPVEVVANYLGKRDGPTGGRDGNTHMGSLRHNIISYISSMAAIVPVAGGIALSFKYRNQENVVLCYFGDGATSRGEWHEALNFAAVFKLPVVYVCNNNQYAYSTPLKRQMAIPHIAERGPAYGIASDRVDGNDVLAVYSAAKKAIERARRGGGPTLLECKTLRMAGHGAHDPALYVPQKVKQQWARRDPILRFERYVVQNCLLRQEKIAEVHESILREIDDAVALAEQSPDPDPKDLLDGVFVNPAPDLAGPAHSSRR